MLHRESGYYKTDFKSDMALFPLPITKWSVGLIAFLFLVIVPLFASDYAISNLNLVAIAVVGTLGLNVLIGYTGQISIGHAAFMSVGAYTAANFALHFNFPWWITIPSAGIMAAGVGMFVGIPSLRIKGLYLAISTLAAQFIIEWIINHTPAISGGIEASIPVDRPTFFGLVINTQTEMYYFLMGFVIIAIVATMNIARSRLGRAFVAIRDQDIAAEIIGISVFKYKLSAFGISSFYAGVTGALYAYYLGIANYEQFQLITSIDYLAMVIIGGLGSVIGSIFGAAFVTLLPTVIREVLTTFGTYFMEEGAIVQFISQIRLVLFGVMIIVFLILEPEGLAKLWNNIKNYFRVWPFSY